MLTKARPKTYRGRGEFRSNSCRTMTWLFFNITPDVDTFLSKIPSLWVSRLHSCMYVPFTFAFIPTRATVLDLISQNNNGGLLHIMGVTVPACQFLCQQHVQNHSKPKTILILTKIQAILLFYRTRPATSPLEDQFEAFQFPTHSRHPLSPIYCLYQLNILLDASHRPVPWLFSSILSTLVYTLCYTTISTIHCTSKFYVMFNDIYTQSS